MDLDAFRLALKQPMPPEGLNLALQALWWDGKNDWERAHHCAQERDDAAGMRVHAYLHRKEGDLGNAAYWYRRCGVAPDSRSLEAEWTELIAGFLT